MKQIQRLLLVVFLKVQQWIRQELLQEMKLWKLTVQKISTGKDLKEYIDAHPFGKEEINITVKRNNKEKESSGSSTDD